MKNSTLLFLGLMSFVFIEAQGQEVNLIPNTRSNKYQIELGFSSLESIIKNTSSATLIFKKKLNSEKLNERSSNFARANLSFDNDLYFKQDENHNTGMGLKTHTANNIQFTIGLGVEKQFQYKKFVHYFGLEIFTHINNSKYYYTNSTDMPILNLDYKYYSRFLDVGAKPFIGIKYFITDQISVGLESGISLAYISSKVQGSDITFGFDPDLGETVGKINTLDPELTRAINFKFLGIRFITLGYSFN